MAVLQDQPTPPFAEHALLAPTPMQQVFTDSRIQSFSVSSDNNMFFTKTIFAFGHFGHFGHYLNILPCRMFDLQSVVAICGGQIEDRLCSICNRRVRHIEDTFSDRSRI